MSEHTFKCPKCNGKMVKGFISDNAELYFYPTYWIEGEFKKDINSLRNYESSSSRISIGGRTPYVIKAIRCEKCGFLESYAV